MRLAYGLLGLSMAGLCGAVAVPQQQEEPKAENVFQNIKSFKGSKASDVIPAMQFMSRSLGVGCEYCHTENRADESKQTKQTAREMIAMQRDINTKNFRGRNQVTCATCHSGHERPIPVPPVEGIDVRTRRSNDVNPDQVLAAYGKAVGSFSSPAPSAFELRGTQTMNKADNQVEVVYSGAKFKITTKTPKGDNRQGFDGTSAWFTTEKGIQSVPLVYAISAVNMWNLYTGPDSLPKLTNPAGGTAQIKGKDMLVVSGMDGAVRVGLYFDKKTGLLARTSFSYPSILGNTTQINDYSDYRKVAGVQIPMTVNVHDSELAMVNRFKSAKADATIDASLFQAPKN